MWINRIKGKALDDIKIWPDYGLAEALEASDQATHLLNDLEGYEEQAIWYHHAQILADLPESLAFEITESAAMGRRHVTARLQELGVRISIDDFGTEYATLERLVTLDVDSLKVDRSFVSEIVDSQRHAAVVEATLSVADALGIPAVAEGVETTRAAHELAQREGIDMPIVAEVHSVLFEDQSPAEAVKRLMLREPKPEFWA